MLRELKIGWIKWIDAVWLAPSEKESLITKYEVHELDIEACKEWNQKARIDNYENYSFLIFHFPKYNLIRKVYEQNEFNIFLWRNYLITFRDYEWNHINKIFDYYSTLKVTTRKKDIKVSTW
jgi:magnesium transporter